MAESASELRAALQKTVRALTEEDIEHAFIGALPVLAWGRARATTDIDLVVIVTGDDWQRLLHAFERHGIWQRRQVGPTHADDRLPDIAVLATTDDPPVRIDLYVAKTDFEREVLATARTASVFGGVVRLARPEASIIYKLLALRPRAIEDVESIFAARRAAGENLDWDFLEQWADAWGIAERLAPYRSQDRSLK